MVSDLPAVINQGLLSWDQDKLDLLKRTICRESTDDEFQLFLHVAKRSGLDPFAKQIHAVKRWNKTANRFDMAIQVGIDGFRLIADRTGAYAGSDDPIYDDESKPSKATVTVYKIVGGQRCPFTATARWAEYYPGDKQGFMWTKMPCLMLGKVAESLALRKAFPAELSGLYTNEEMQQADPKHTVYPEQPGPDDGIREEGVLIKYGGKLAGKLVHKCDPVDLRNLVNEIEAKAARVGKPVPDWAKPIIVAAEPIIAAYENANESGSEG